MEHEALGKSREFENMHAMPKHIRQSMNEENEKLTHAIADGAVSGEQVQSTEQIAAPEHTESFTLRGRVTEEV